MDEEALLKQFAAQFAHGPDDADDTDAAAAAQGADSTANQVADDADQSPATFDTQQFLNGLDAIFDRHTAATEAGPYLEQAMVDAENAGDEAGLLTVLNETMGFYRSQGRHKENQWIVQRALELAARMGLTTGTSEAWAITLINCATSMRAAKQYDQPRICIIRRRVSAGIRWRPPTVGSQHCTTICRCSTARRIGPTRRNWSCVKRCALSKPRA